jgi:transcriptional regulator GlxA family with amidase domain
LQQAGAGGEPFTAQREPVAARVAVHLDLAGRRATTHWERSMSSPDSGVEVDPDARYVDHGDVITSAGVSAGIDMALHLVARLHSRERAAEVRRHIQYDPEPPV